MILIIIKRETHYHLLVWSIKENVILKIYRSQTYKWSSIFPQNTNKTFCVLCRNDHLKLTGYNLFLQKIAENESIIFYKNYHHHNSLDVINQFCCQRNNFGHKQTFITAGLHCSSTILHVKSVKSLIYIILFYLCLCARVKCNMEF